MTTKTILLRRTTVLYTGYLGHGIPAKSIELPAGSEVAYSTHRIDPDCDYLPYLETGHCVSIERGGLQYSAYRSTFALRHPFEATTYYSWAIRKLPTGVWSGSVIPGYWADDGFGSLVATPREFDSSHRYNEHSSCKMVVDCVEGPVYFF